MTKKILLGVGCLWGLSACSGGAARMRTAPDSLSVAEHLRQGDAAAARKEKSQAIEQYQAALDQDPRCIPALMALGNLAFADQDWRAARNDFQRVLKITPHDPAAINDLAMVDLAENTRLDEARERLDGVAPVSGALRPYLLDTLANIALRQNRWTDAEQALEQAQAAAPPDNPDLNHELQMTRDKLSAAVKAQLTPTR